MNQVEVMKIRGDAASYARHFLARKYRTEYIELYAAYCKNRGLATRLKPNKPLVDERLLVRE